MVEKKEFSAEFEGLIHGISPERLISSTIQSMMLCPMCECIFWNPQTCSTPDCGRTLCEPCLKRTVEDQETCKDCHQPTKYDPISFFAKSFKNLTFRCENHPKCQETFIYKDLPYHICSHTQMKCPISECEWEGERQELEKHLPQCPKEIIRCQNEGCGNKHQRGNMGDHISECMFQNILCPQVCGFEGRRGELEEHLITLCSLVQVNCEYKGRGCEYNPLRKDYQDHIFGCLYQPKLLKCGHQVNLKDEDEHSEICNEFPHPCSKCGYIFTRGQLLDHSCFPFLHDLIAQKENKIEAQEHKIETQKHKIQIQDHKIEDQEHKIETQEHKIETQEHKIKTQEHKIETQEHKIQTQDPKIEAQEHNIEAQEHKIVSLEHNMTAQKKENETQKKKIISLVRKNDNASNRFRWAYLLLGYCLSQILVIF